MAPGLQINNDVLLRLQLFKFKQEKHVNTLTDSHVLSDLADSSNICNRFMSISANNGTKIIIVQS